MIPSFGLLIMLGCFAFYYRVGLAEYSSGLPLAGISLLLWLGAAYCLRWGLARCLLLQAGIFVAMTIWNMIRNKPL